MNYLRAQMRKDGRWEYTRNNRPTGYCLPLLGESYEFEHKHHCDGHATKEEAQACYTEYLLDNKLRFSSAANQQHRCCVCDEWTSGYADIDTSIYMVCDVHSNRETIAKVMGSVSEIRSS